jgi:hypothetical protein
MDDSLMDESSVFNDPDDSDVFSPEAAAVSISTNLSIANVLEDGLSLIALVLTAYSYRNLKQRRDAPKVPAQRHPRPLLKRWCKPR